MRWGKFVLIFCGLAVFVCSAAAYAKDAQPKVTILYDAFGSDQRLKHGWGYSALIEFGGRRILFDTGGNLDDFQYNVEKLHMDLTHLDFVVLSHRHGDHTAGLNYVLSINPDVTIYTPVERAGFGTPRSAETMASYTRPAAGVPADLIYFDGKPPQASVDTPPWPKAHFVQIRQTTEVLPGFFMVTNRSDKDGTLEMNEISLAIRTSQGLVIVVGCSHPGIEKILTSITTTVDPEIYEVFGGLHLIDKQTNAEITALVESFRAKWGISRMAAGHCSGQFTFAELVRLYGDHFDHGGVGNMISLPGG